MKQIYTTTLRLNLADEDDRRAYEHLQQMDKKQYRSYSKAIVTAINDHFERQARLASDPYLETREKDDAFLGLIQRIIEKTNTISKIQYCPLPADDPLQRKPVIEKAKELLERLFEYYMKHPMELPAQYTNMIANGGKQDRVVCDYIAGMTDQYATAKFSEYFVPKAWQVN